MVEYYDFDHLTPEAAALIDAPAEHRIRAIWDTPWIDYPRASELLTVLNDLVSRPQTTRMPSVAIYADSGMGKTMLLKRFLAQHQGRYDSVAMVEHTPVIAIQMAARPTEKRFFSQMLNVLGAPPNQRLSLSDIEVVALRILRHVGARMILIDEVHNMLAASYSEQRALLNLIRFLSNELQLSIVCLGVSDAREAISGDVQLARRFREYRLPRWQADDAFQALLVKLIRNMPLKLPSQLSARAQKTLLADSDGVTAQIVSRLQEAAVHAIQSGLERIDDDLLDRIEPPRFADVRFA